MAGCDMDIHQVAKLARIALTPDEAQRYEAQLNRVLTHMEQLAKVNLEAQPSAHSQPLFDVLRHDEIRPGLSHEAALSNAPRQTLGQFQIPKVIE